MGLAIEPDQLQFFEFTYPISMAPLKMIVPAPVEESRLPVTSRFRFCLENRKIEMKIKRDAEGKK